MRTELLEKIMITKGITKEMLAKVIDINPSTLYRKLAKNGEGFTVKEAMEIKKFLDLSNEDAATIFFNEKLA